MNNVLDARAMYITYTERKQMFSMCKKSSIYHHCPQLNVLFSRFYYFDFSNVITYSGETHLALKEKKQRQRRIGFYKKKNVSITC